MGELKLEDEYGLTTNWTVIHVINVTRSTDERLLALCGVPLATTCKLKVGAPRCHNCKAVMKKILESMTKGEIDAYLEASKAFGNDLEEA